MKSRSRSNRARRRDDTLNALAKLLGGCALILMVASVFYVGMSKLWEGPKLESQTVEMFQRQRGMGSLTAQATAPQEVPPAVAAQLAKTPPAAVPAQTPAAVPTAAAVPNGITDIESVRPKIAAALEQFFSAVSWEQKVTSIRDPARVRPLMEQYYADHAPPAFKWKGLGWALPIEEPGHRLGYVQALFEDSEPISVIIEQSETGEIVVDWESSVRYGEMSWPDFLSQRPTEPKLLRVIVSRAPGSSGDSYRAEEWLEIRHPSGGDAVMARVNLQDPALKDLHEQMQAGDWSEVPVTLRLCFPGAATANAPVRIAGIEGKGWLILHQSRS